MRELYRSPIAAVASRSVVVRVLWLVKGLGPGGAEHLLAAAAEAHDLDEFEIECAYVVPGKDHLAERLERAGVRCRCLSTRIDDASWPIRLRRLIVDGEWAVVHAHSPLLAAAARTVIRSMPSCRRPAMITTEHNEWHTFATPTRLVNTLTAAVDDVTFAVSESTRRSMTRRAADRAVTLHHGVDVGAIAALRSSRDEVRDELGLAPDAFVVGTVANYRAQKDYPNLLRALRTAVDSGSAVRLVAVGQGPLADEVSRAVTELGLDDAVVLTGHRADAARVMSAFDVFTLASFHEGLPVALMEAFALGLPVVATAVGGVADVLRDGHDALLVPARDHRALADAWCRVHDDPALRERLAERSLRRSTEFDVRGSVAVIEDRYRTLARDPLPAVMPPANRRRTGSAPIDVRRAADSDRPAIVALCRAALDWPAGRLADDLFEWKHDRNAFGRSESFVATHDDRIVGFRTFMHWEFRRGADTLRAVRAVDTATHPEMRGRGVFRALTLHGLDALGDSGVDFVFNTPNAQSLPGYLTMGWRGVGRLPASLHVVGAAGLAASLRSRVPAELVSMPTSLGVAFDDWFTDDHRSPSLRGHDARALATAWTTERLRWRFGGALMGYRVIPGAAPGSGVVVRLRRRGRARELVSLVALGVDPAEADRLVVRAVRGSDVTHVLRLGAPAIARGFVPVPRVGPVLAWRALDMQAAPPLPQWSLTMGDVELF